MAWLFCSKEDVIGIHPVTAMELKDEWSDWVEQLIKEHMGLPYLGTSEVISDEIHDGDGSYIIHVRKPPILSVQAVKVNDAVLVASDYQAFPTFIELRGQVFPAGVLNVKLSYTSGVLAVNPNIRMTAAAMIAAIVNYRKRAGADSSLKWSAADQKMGEDDPNKNVGLTSHLIAIMRRMLKRPYVRVR